MDSTLYCRKCGETKPLKEFPLSSQTGKHVRPCRACKNKRNAQRRADEREAAGVVYRFDVMGRFWSKVNKDGPEVIPGSPCWIWTGTVFSHGYGAFSIDGKNGAAHRASYKLLVGDIPNGLEVLHQCDVPLCIRPDHLWLGTQLDNMQDKVAKGRVAMGERVGTAVLSEADVRKMRAMRASGSTCAELACIFGIGKGTAARIVKGETWKHVT